MLRLCVLRPSSSFPGSHFNTGRNAAWLGVEWSMEPHTVEEVAALAADLRARQVSTIYAYVSYLKPGGTFNPTYEHAVEFVSNLKQAAPHVRVQAWLGIPLAVPAGVPIASGYVDLSDTAIRRVIVVFSQFAVRDLGFDGVHLDAEPVCLATEPCSPYSMKSVLSLGQMRVCRFQRGRSHRCFQRPT